MERTADHAAARPSCCPALRPARNGRREYRDVATAASDVASPGRCGGANRFAAYGGPPGSSEPPGMAARALHDGVQVKAVRLFGLERGLVGRGGQEMKVS